MDSWIFLAHQAEAELRQLEANSPQARIRQAWEELSRQEGCRNERPFSRILAMVVAFVGFVDRFARANEAEPAA
jgi:hypothetical protein